MSPSPTWDPVDIVLTCACFCSTWWSAMANEMTCFWKLVCLMLFPVVRCSLSLSIAAAVSVASNGVATLLQLPCLMLLQPFSLNILVFGVCHHTLLQINDPHMITVVVSCCIFYFAWPTCADPHSVHLFFYLVNLVQTSICFSSCIAEKNWHCHSWYFSTHILDWSSCYLVSAPVDRKKGSNIDWGGVELVRFSFSTSFLFLSLVLPLSWWLLAFADAASVGACFGAYGLLPECQFWQNRQQWVLPKGLHRAIYHIYQAPGRWSQINVIYIYIS